MAWAFLFRFKGVVARGDGKDQPTSFLFPSLLVLTTTSTASSPLISSCMNGKDNIPPNLCHIPSDNNPVADQFPGESVNSLKLEQFIDQYCPPVYSAISRLCSLSHGKDLEELTTQVLGHLWHYRAQFTGQPIPGRVIYRKILQHIFPYLKEQGNEERIQLLKDILPIDPHHYGIPEICWKKRIISFLQSRSAKIIKSWKTS